MRYNTAAASPVISENSYGQLLLGFMSSYNNAVIKQNSVNSVMSLLIKRWYVGLMQ
jgi:hypothetical protein